MNKSALFAALISASALTTVACTTTEFGSDTQNPQSRPAIKADVDQALDKLVRQIPEAKDLMNDASAVLVFPDVLSAGFVVGGSYGQGALMRGNEILGQYRMTAASAGLLAGAKTKSVYLVFLTDDALADFRSSADWTVGADASVTLLDASATAAISSKTARQPVVGYVISNTGLMANLALEGTKITRLDPS